MAFGERFCTRVGIEIPIIQAPMAGAGGVALAVGVARAGGLGSLPGAMLPSEQLNDQISEFRRSVDAPVNVNFFCHELLDASPASIEAWSTQLARFDAEFGVDRLTAAAAPPRVPFDDAACRIVEQLRPEVVSFHFGLPSPELVERVRRAGAIVMSTATIRAEATWLEQNGCDVIIAQGAEAGGHSGMFLTTDVEAQPGTMALVPRVVDAVGVPVVAAGGIADARGIAAALTLGADAVQLGTAYLLCPEALISPLHRAALRDGAADDTVLTNVFTGRPARGRRNRMIDALGPIATDAPPFPFPAAALAPLRAAAEAAGSTDFTPLWSGQGGAASIDVPAAQLTRTLATDARRLLTA